MVSLYATLRHIVGFMKEEGTKECLFRFVKAVLSPVYKSEELYIYENNLLGIAGAGTCKLPVNFSFATIENIGELERIMFHPGHMIESRFKRDNKCFAGYVHGKIVYCAWLGFSKVFIPEIDRDIYLDRSEAYIYNVRTLRAYRNKGIATYAYSKILEYCRENGFKKATIAVCGRNKSSVKSIEKSGFKRSQEIKYAKVLWAKRYRERI